jgi:competence protein ComEC
MSILAMNLELHQKPGPQHISRYLREEKLLMYGMISVNPQVSPDKLTLIVSVFRIQEGREFIPVDGNILLNVVTDEPFKYGDIIRFRAKLKIPHNFNNPGGFDYERYLRCRNILVRGFINNPANIIVLRENQGNPLKLSLERFRSDLKKLIRENSPSPYGEIVQAMILGDQKEIPPEVMDKFNQTGTSHIIAISGFNVGIIAIFSIFLFRILMKSSEVLLLKFNIVKISTALSFIPIAIFTFIAGMGVSVVRATIMALTFLVAILLGKVRDLYNTLALAALIILVISPPSLFDISFQLPFMAVGRFCL